MIIKAIIFDLDGTLLNSSHYVPAKEKEYIYKLYNRKIKIIIATGRGEDAFLLTNEIPCSGIILNNGMQIYNNDKLIKRNFIAKSKVLPMIKKLNSCGLLIGGVKSGIHYTNFNAQKMWNDITNWSCMQIENLPEKLDKLYVICRTKSDIKFIKKILPSEFYISIARDKLIFIMPRGISKFTALENLLEIYNITAKDAVSFGDDINDLELIKKCGLGIAMGNALDIIKKSADYVTLKNDDGGISKILDELFLV